MKLKNLVFSIIAVAIATVSASAFGQDVPPQFQEVAKTIGRAGTLNADGSYRINFPRNDVTFVSSSGMAIPADLGLATYIAMSGSADRVLAVGDVAMLEGEIDGVMDALHNGGFEIVSLHNHMTAEEPRLFFMHFQAVGVPGDIATKFRRALLVLGHGTPKSQAAKVGKPMLDADALTKILGPKPQTFPSGVLRFANPRKDTTVTVNGEKFTTGMGLGSWAAFSACECGLTMVMGDTCCFRSDLQQAIGALRGAGIHITAIHNHTLGGSQDAIFMHFEGEGDSLKVAQGIRSCWNVLGKS